MYLTKAPYLLAGTLAHGLQAVSQPERHQHGGPDRFGRRRADAAGEPEADAEPGESDHRVHGAGLSLRCADAGRGLPEQPRRGAIWPGSTRPRSPGRRTHRSAAWSKTHHLGQPQDPERCSAAGRQRLEKQHRLGRLARSAGENIVWGTVLRDGENIVWGTSSLDGENIVWGTMNDGENIVWGTLNVGENIVWGTLRDAENIVWGTIVRQRQLREHRLGHDAARCREHRVGHVAAGREHRLGHARLDGENIVWGTSDEAAVPVLFNDLGVTDADFESLFPPDIAPVLDTTVQPVASTVTGLLGGL